MCFISLQVIMLYQGICLYMYALFAHFIHLCINLLYIPGGPDYFVLFTSILFAF